MHGYHFVNLRSADSTVCGHRTKELLTAGCVLRGFLRGIKLNVNWRVRYNDQLMQLFGLLDMVSFVRTSRLNWIGRVNRMDSKSKLSQVFNSNPQGI